MPPTKADPELKLKAPTDPTHWGPGCMLRTRDWKLCQYSHDQGELYDLRSDPYEMNNLYGDPDFADIQSDLQERLNRRQLMLGQAPEHAEPGVNRWT